MTVSLAARRVTKLYGRSARALNDLTLELRTGSITALVGPNGAGKTTLMRLWLGFERPSRGLVSVAGRDSTGEARPVRIGYVSQRPALYAGISVYDHLALAKHYRHDFDIVGATKRLDEVGLDLSRRAGRLSGGQQAQLALVIALGLRAEILLLDEPLASLDPLARRQFLTVLLATARELGATTVLSSHIVSEIVDVCDELVVMSAGQLAYQGTLKNALDEHVTVSGDLPTVVSASVVGVFPEMSGGRSTLVRRLPHVAVPFSRSPTIEEIVLGYLASPPLGQIGSEVS